MEARPILRKNLRLIFPLLALTLLLGLACGSEEPVAQPPAQATADSSPVAAVQQQQTTPSHPASQKQAPSAEPEGEVVNVVTTSNIVADWVKAVGQDRVDVFSMLPPNTDPHTYQSGAQDIARVADADLVISGGLGLEAGWLNELVENAAQDPSLIIELGNEVDPIDFVGLTEDNEPDHEEGEESSAEVDGHEENGEEDHHEGLDPHFWFDPLRVKQAINSVAAQLSSVDPAGQTLYRDNAAAYSQELDDLHAWIEAEVELLPVEQRLLVTSHDSFQYFAQRYSFEIVGALMPTTTEVEPSAQDLAKLMETIEHSGAKAVFAEKSQTDRLSRQIAEDTGARLIGGLYTGSLGQPGGEAGTYLDFMRYNVSTIVEFLKEPGHERRSLLKQSPVPKGAEK